MKRIYVSLALLAAVVQPLYAGPNLLSNPSFETQGSWSEMAQYWEWDNPDQHGSLWGSAARMNWRANSGSWEATIRGAWAGAGNNGGWWQEVEVEPGLTYQASAWLWADGPGNLWTAQVQELKIEWYDPNYVSLEQDSISIQGIGETWTQRVLQAVAPDEAVWGRFVIYASGFGQNGALQIDDVELRSVATRDQDFSGWLTQTSDDCHERDEWFICTGKVTTVNARGGTAATLPNPGAETTNGNYVQSAYLDGGLGVISFWYRHGTTSTEEEPDAPVSLAVSKSDDGSDWERIATVTNIISLQYANFALFQFDTSAHYLRIEHAGGSTNRLLIDDIEIAEPVTAPRYMDFNTWPAGDETNGCHAYMDWNLCTGRTVMASGDYSTSAALPGNETFTNAVVSPFFSDGYGTISFKYARGSNGEAPANLLLQASPDGTNWATIGGVTALVNTVFTDYSKYFYSPSGSYVRVANVVISNSSPVTTLIEEHFLAGDDAPPGWSFSGISETYTSDRYSGDEPPSIKFDDQGDTATTPTLASPTNLTFWLKGAGSMGSSEFAIETYNGSWSLFATINPIPTTEGASLHEYVLSTNVTMVRFNYTFKDSGNVALDDVLIEGEPAGPQPGQDLYVDNINIQKPELVRLQDFDNWPVGGTYGDYEYEGWIVSDGAVDDDFAYAGEAVRFRSNGANVESPRFPEGVGTISFWYRSYSGVGDDPVYNVQRSTNGVDWVTMSNITITTTSYQQFVYYTYDTTSRFVRIHRQSGSPNSSIAVFDEIYVQEPLPPASVDVQGWHDPSTPYTNDLVDLWANARPSYGAQNIAITSYYRIGTSGVFTPLPMSVTTLVSYVSASPITNQPAGTTVQYYFDVTFDGPGSQLSSPSSYPSGGSNNPTEYHVPRNEPGAVWINELNYVNSIWYGAAYDTNEFVEIAGPAGWDISGWTIQLLYDPDSATYGGDVLNIYAEYTIPDNTLLSDETAGFGFYVLGDETVGASDMIFTHTNGQDFSQIFDATAEAGGIRLLNEGGGVEHTLAYEGPLSDFDRTYYVDPSDFFDTLDPLNIQLTGQGTNYGNFAWSTNAMTPGAANVDQFFADLDIPQVWFYSMYVDAGFMWFETSTSSWDIVPFYATNLPTGPQDWMPIPTYNESTPPGGNTNYIWFTQPTEEPRFYRLRVTEP